MENATRNNIQIFQEEWLGKEKGLREELENSEKLQSVKCPGCRKSVEFYPDNLYWDTDGEFEFCDVSCLACNEKFELNAISGTVEYDFFTTEG